MILVIGCGYVGGTIADVLEEHNIKVVRIDPKLNDNKIKEYLNADGAIICLPTPTENDEPDDSVIKQVVEGLKNMRILIKSTILHYQLENYPENVSYSQEFLREQFAKDDYLNQKYVVWGGERKQIGWWLNIFRDLKKQNLVTTRETASMVKYVHNCWLATKVAFFHDLYSKLDVNVNYTEMTGILSMFENIGPSHMKVYKLGYDGSCFPKDMEAFTNYTGSKILKTVIEVNDNLVRAR